LPNSNVNIKMAIDELHVGFTKLNDMYFGGKLPEVALLIQTQGKRLSYGWCSVDRIWRSFDLSIQKYEINICAEHLDRDVYGITGTLLHEMVHLNNLIRGIQDCSRGGTYHNTVFKDSAERVGLEVTFSEQYGWAFTRLKDKIEVMNGDVFKIARVGMTKDGKKQVSKWKMLKCDCGNRIKMEVNEDFEVRCGDCGELFM
jgi:hypothetical protein